MNFTSVPQGGLRKYCIDSQNWWRVIIAPASVTLGPVPTVKLMLRSGLSASSCARRGDQTARTDGHTGGT